MVLAEVVAKCGSNTSFDDRGRLVHDADIRLRDDAEALRDVDVDADVNEEGESSPSVPVPVARRSSRSRKPPDRLGYD